MPEPTPQQPSQPSQPTPPQQTGIIGLLTSLASGGDNWVKIGIIAMLILGGGNILATKSSSDLNVEEMKQTMKEIHALYQVIDSSIERQKRIEQTLDQMNKK